MKILIVDDNYETKKEFEIKENDIDKLWGKTLEIDGKLFIGAIYSPQENIYQIKPIKINDVDNNDEEFYTDNFECMVCGYDDNDLYNSDDDFECGRCGSVFEVEVETQLNYNVRLKEKVGKVVLK